MKTPCRLLIAFLTALALAGFSHGQTRGMKVISVKDDDGRSVDLYQQSFALVVGVGEYSAGWPRLAGVTEEVRGIETALKNNGFAVQKILDPNGDQLRKAYADFVNQHGYDSGNRLLFYFSGHGWSRKGGEHGYLVPTDAPDPRQDEKEFLRRSLSMSQVLTWCKEMEARHALFLFDSCFSGTIFKTRALPDTPPHITALTARPVRQFITAGDAGEEVPAKSVFATCFIRALTGDADLSKDGYVTGTELGMYLHDKVIYYQTGQTPQYGKMRDPELDEGDFVFLLRETPAIPQPPQAQPNVVSVPVPAPVFQKERRADYCDPALCVDQGQGANGIGRVKWSIPEAVRPREQVKAEIEWVYEITKPGESKE